MSAPWPPHLDVVLGVAPVALRVEVAQLDDVLLPERDLRDGARDFACHERLTCKTTNCNVNVVCKNQIAVLFDDIQQESAQRAEALKRGRCSCDWSETLRVDGLILFLAMNYLFAVNVITIKFGTEMAVSSWSRVTTL